MYVCVGGRAGGGGGRVLQIKDEATVCVFVRGGGGGEECST